MAEFVTRMFTPSDSDRSGMVRRGNMWKFKKKKPEVVEEKKPLAKTRTRFGGRQTEEAVTGKKTLLGA